MGYDGAMENKQECGTCGKPFSGSYQDHRDYYCEADEVAGVRWEAVVLGRTWRTVGLPGGQWCLDRSSVPGDVYILHPEGSCRGIEIKDTGPHGTRGAAMAWIEELRAR
jgi:hypothetical protein